MQAKNDAYSELVTVALTILANTPKRKNKWSQSAYVPWSTIEELRAVLNRGGITDEQIDGVRRLIRRG